MKNKIIYSIIALLFFSVSCKKNSTSNQDKTAKEILGNSKYQAFSFGTYRYKTRDSVPSVNELKDDLKLTAALGVKLVRTYNTTHYKQASNLLQAIKELKESDSNFEMYVMLGTWMQCDGAWTKNRNHEKDHTQNNKAEIDKAVRLANQYPTIVKMIAVGNESMIRWADGYYVTPKIILKWVNYLQELKKTNKLLKNIWITSSDNYEAWGGGSKSYRTKDLENLIKAVDFISLHTYPYHATNYHPEFWGIPANEEKLSKIEKIDAAMLRSKNFAMKQYQTTVDYVASLGIEKPIHIGEIGWSTIASSTYGDTGSHASDEYKGKLFYDHIRQWTTKENITCFYFKLMDESWKAKDIRGSENNFGLIKMNGEAKYALWDAVDKGVFKGITRNGKEITKSFNGNKDQLIKTVLLPPTLKEIGILAIETVNKNNQIGQAIKEEKYLISHSSLIPNATNKATYPSTKLLFSPIDGSCKFNMLDDKVVRVKTGTGKWWACSLKVDDENYGENFINFKKGYLNFEIKGETTSSFQIGFQTGNYGKGTLKSNFINFGSKEAYKLMNTWKKHSIPIKTLNTSNNLNDITSVLSLKGISEFDGKEIFFRNIYYSKN